MAGTATGGTVLKTRTKVNKQRWWSRAAPLFSRFISDQRRAINNLNKFLRFNRSLRNAIFNETRLQSGRANPYLEAPEGSTCLINALPGM